MISFAEFVAERDPSLLDEGFWDSMRKSFGQSYDAARGNPEQDQDLSKWAAQYADKAGQGIAAASAAAKNWSQKLGVPLPLATAVIASGIVGGPAAVPFAAMMYFVRQPINKLASKTFDYGAQKMGLMPKPATAQPAVSATAQPAHPPYAGTPVSVFAPTQKDAGDFSAATAHRESFIDPNMTFAEFLSLYEQEVIDEWFGDWAGKKIGQAAGWLGGKAVKYGANVANMIKNAAKSIYDFASKNKLSIAKVAFMVGVGSLIGAGVGAAVNKASSVLQSVQDSGIVPHDQVAELQQSLGAEEAATAVQAKADAAQAASTAVDAKTAAADTATQAAVDAKTNTADAAVQAKATAAADLTSAKSDIVSSIATKGRLANDIAYDAAQKIQGVLNQADTMPDGNTFMAQVATIKKEIMREISPFKRDAFEMRFDNYMNQLWKLNNIKYTIGNAGS